jgi:S1-C subfamily serine protease
MRKPIVVLLLLVTVSAAGADTIFLKDGRRIETPGTWEENGQVRYFDQGRIGPPIPKADVLKIEGDRPAPPNSATPAPHGAYNLQQRLAERSPARSPVESARNATVAIETLTGHGSGFFITEDGFLFTNKHVVEADAVKLAQIKSRLTQQQQQLEGLAQQLEAMKKHLVQMEKAMADDPKRYDHPTNKTRLEDTRRDYNAGLQLYNQRRLALEAGQKEYRQLAGKKAYRTGITIFLIDGTELKADVMRISNRLDLALLRLFDYRTPFVLPARTGGMSQGERLFAIGNPLTFRHAVTDGVFSGVHQGMVMTSAPINPGNSGGPLVTADGKAVGISTMKVIGEGIEGIGFAIPFQTAAAEFADLLKNRVQIP